MEIAAIVFVLIMLFVAYLVFRILKKTVKLAIRAIIVLVLIAVALVGGSALWSVKGDVAKSIPSTTQR